MRMDILLEFGYANIVIWQECFSFFSGFKGCMYILLSRYSSLALSFYLFILPRLYFCTF